MTLLGTRCREDALLGTVAPMALAAAAGTALVVDADPAGGGFSTPGSLAALVAEGPRGSDLVPRRRGVAVLTNGGVGWEEALPLIEALARGWPHVVVRLPASGATDLPFPAVPVIPLLPGSGAVDGPAVYQKGPWPAPRHLEGVVLARPPVRVVRRLLEGRSPGRSRWVAAWRPVWGLPWP